MARDLAAVEAQSERHRGTTPMVNRRGRPRSIPERLFVRVHAMHRTGLGYQAIALELSRLGIATSRGSVERLVKGLPPYDNQRIQLAGSYVPRA